MRMDHGSSNINHIYQRISYLYHGVPQCYPYIWMECISSLFVFAGELTFHTLVEAEVSHTKKYMDSYAKLYPYASQILVRSRQRFFWSGRKSKVSLIRCYMNAIR